MDLSARKIQILQAIIDDYIMSGTPVGSRTLSKKYNMGLSSATIRNEMSDLEELGFLDQPHISSGRIPSVKAYRLYVDSLLQSGSIKHNSNLEIKSHFSSHIHRIEDVVERATQVLSELTNYTAIALLPENSSQVIRSIQLIQVTADTALIVVVMMGGTVHNRLIRISPYLNKNTLDNISDVLTERLANRNIAEVPDILREVLINLNLNADFVNNVNESMEAFFEEGNQKKLKAVGASNLLNYPDFLSIDKAKNLLSLLDTQDELVGLLRQNGQMAFTVQIGPETGIEGLQDCSLITATYSTSKDAKGTIGIIGPTRMPYKQIIEILNTVGREITHILDDE
ncbi:MAG: heat-inducible transcriptional repressor HrcA [Eubacteriales bacterium]|nr:heat-inducible transcriptional repressor HrcA [Eubacteriales bacterium]